MQPVMVRKPDFVNKYNISHIIYGVANHNSMMSSVSAAIGAHTYSQRDPLSGVGCITDLDVIIKHRMIYILSLLRGADLMMLSTRSRSCCVLAS